MAPRYRLQVSSSPEPGTDRSKIDAQTPEFLATYIWQKAPGGLATACKGLAEIAESAIRQDQTLDRQRAVTEVRHHLHGGAEANLEAAPC